MALVGTFYWSYFLWRPVGRGPCGPIVDHGFFEASWTERSVFLVGIGDSITAGFGVRREDHSFFNRLIRNPDDEYTGMNGICLSRVIRSLKAENLAISGSTSRVHLAVIEEQLPQQNHNVFGLVLITTGGNDLIHNYGRSSPEECAMYGATLSQAEPWISAFRSRLNEMVKKIEQRFPGGCEIYLADIYDPTDSVGDKPSMFLPFWPDGLAILAKYNAAIVECAKSNRSVHVVPLHQTFMGHGSHCRQFWRFTYVPEDPTFWFHRNIEDPNDRGYDAIRRVFLNTILKHSVLAPSNAER